MALLEAAGLVGAGHAQVRFEALLCSQWCWDVASFNSKASNLRSRRARSLEVIYKGPFREVRDDGGRVLRGAGASRYPPTSLSSSERANGPASSPSANQPRCAPYPSPPAVAREAISLLTPASPARIEIIHGLVEDGFELLTFAGAGIAGEVGCEVKLAFRFKTHFQVR